MKKVLVIEDDRFITDDLLFFIEAEGNQCELYTRASEVVENLSELGKYDLIVLDIMMRKGPLIKKIEEGMETGEFLFKMIRKSYPKLRMIIISAKDYGHMKIKFKKEANVDTLSKPTNEEFYKDLVKLIGK